MTSPLSLSYELAESRINVDSKHDAILEEEVETKPGWIFLKCSRFFRAVLKDCGKIKGSSAGVSRK